MTRAELLNALIRHGYGSLAAEIAPHVRDTISICPIPTPEDEIPVGASKFGGNPDVPAGFEWPEWEGKPMEFLSQIRLEEAAPFDTAGLLPKKGLLSFFAYSINDCWPTRNDENNTSWRVFYFSSDGLRQSPYPCEGWYDPHVWPAAAVTFMTHYVCHYPIEIPLDMMADWQRITGEPALRNGNEVKHLLLGYPWTIQRSPDEMAADCEYSVFGVHVGERYDFDIHGDWEAYTKRQAPFYAEAAKNWQLLLQLDTDRDLGWAWGDGGRLFFWIPKDDLANGRFDRCWLKAECS